MLPGFQAARSHQNPNEQIWFSYEEGAGVFFCHLYSLTRQQNMLVSSEEQMYTSKYVATANSSLPPAEESDGDWCY